MKPSLSKYKHSYDLRSVKHVDTMMRYGPEATFGYPEFHDTQRQRVKYILSKLHGCILDVGCDSGYVLGQMLIIKYIPKVLGDPLKNDFNVEKIMRLGFKAKMDLKSGLKELLEHLKKE